MATDGKQRLTTPPRMRTGASGKLSQPPAPKQQPQTATTTPAPAATRQQVIPSRNDTFGATGAYLKSNVEKRPYLKWAFANPYNISLLVGAVAASVLTLNPLPAIIALGLEGLWLLHGPESKLLRRILWDPRFEQLRLSLEQQQLEERIKNLTGRERERVEKLVHKQQEIQRLAAQNPSFTGELLRSELQKTGRLVDAFIDMAVTCARYEAYLDSIDIPDLEGDRRRWEKIVNNADDNDPSLEIAQKNLAVILKRFEKLTEIRRYLTIATGQLDLIENSFQLIADQIVTMQSPQELTGQLNELLDGVESIKQTAIDTERMLNSF
ncbi:MAG TPA: hypothetical protein VNA19_04210 [Pyrinomonadaceae bacterium]|jgi:hypothetical protein|nr:hypothetical protein [Pyrinomonadaceae bacterium]